MQSDGNFCLQPAVWCAFTEGSWGSDTLALMQDNGNLGIFEGAWTLVKGSLYAGFLGLIPVNTP